MQSRCGTTRSRFPTMHNDDDNWGKKLVALLAEKGKSQADLARAAGVNGSTINRWTAMEKPPDARRSAAQLAKAAEALGIDLEDFAPRVKEHLGDLPSDAVWAVCFNQGCPATDSRGPFNGTGPVVHHWRRLTTEEAERVKFCPWCGRELVTKCRGCDRPLAGQDHVYCVTCGTELNEQAEKARKRDEYHERKRIYESNRSHAIEVHSNNPMYFPPYPEMGNEKGFKWGYPPDRGVLLDNNGTAGTVVETKEDTDAESRAGWSNDDGDDEIPW